MTRKQIIIPFIPVIFLIIISTLCYHLYDEEKKEPVKINLKKPLIIFSASGDSPPLNVKYTDMLSAKTDAVAKTSATVSVDYKNLVEPYHFYIVMKGISGYQKTPGVDGVENKEYTYEVLRNNEIIVDETELESFEKDSEIILLDEKLILEKGFFEYKIIFRFYANNLDQNHLAGHNFNNIIFTKEAK